MSLGTSRYRECPLQIKIRAYVAYKERFVKDDYLSGALEGNMIAVVFFGSK